MVSALRDWPLRKKLWWGYVAGAALFLCAMLPLIDYANGAPNAAYLYYLSPALLTLPFGWVGEKTGFAEQTPNDLVKLTVIVLLIFSMPVMFWASSVAGEMTFMLLGDTYSVGGLILSLMAAPAVYLLPPVLFAMGFAGVSGE